MHARGLQHDHVPAPPLHALFQRRVSGDDALLDLARLRFEQFGLAAEVYGGSASDLDHTLGFVPGGARPPTVHLARNLDLLRENDRAKVAALVRHAGDRVSGFVVHDQRGMPARLDELHAAAADLSPILTESGPARLYLEYAAGCHPSEFVAMAAALDGLPQVGMCIDIGHVGVRESRRAFARLRPDIDVDLAHLQPTDARLPELVDDVQAAVGAGLPAVLMLTAALADLGLPTHYHLHDGHPLIPGLSDHFGFLNRLPIPFVHRGLRALDPLYGVTGLAAILTATHAFAPGQVSLTLEIHQVDARLPLGDAASLFDHWSDPTNAERMNAFLSVLTQHSMLVAALLPR
jgi:sugar phosphate isomerase/epimerase